MKKRSMGILLSCLLAVSQLTLSTVAQARNNPTSPNISTTSSIDFDQVDIGEDSTLYAFSGILPYPTFDFENEDIEVEVTQLIGPTSIQMVNIDLPSGFVADEFDASDTYIEVYGDTVCTTFGGDTSVGDGEIEFGWSLTLSSDGVTAKGFNCFAADGIVEFRFDVDDVKGYITTTSVGSYSIESQFRTAENRKIRPSAYVVETANLLTLSAPVIP